MLLLKYFGYIQSLTYNFDTNINHNYIKLSIFFKNYIYIKHQTKQTLVASNPCRADKSLSTEIAYGLSAYSRLLCTVYAT